MCPHIPAHTAVHCQPHSLSHTPRMTTFAQSARGPGWQPDEQANGVADLNSKFFLSQVTEKNTIGIPMKAEHHIAGRSALAEPRRHRRNPPEKTCKNNLKRSQLPEVLLRGGLWSGRRPHMLKNHEGAPNVQTRRKNGSPSADSGKKPASA